MLTPRSWSSHLPLAVTLCHVGPCEPTRCLARNRQRPEKRALAEKRKASVDVSLMRLIFFFSSFLAGSESWTCCQTSGAGLRPKWRLCAGTSHGEWVHDEEPFTEAANNETTADAGTVLSASVGSCAIHLTGRTGLTGMGKSPVSKH